MAVRGNPLPPTPRKKHIHTMYVAIAGLIGAGKSTLAESLAKELEVPVYYEPVEDNVYLDDFYRDPASYAFPLEMYLLAARVNQQRQIICSNKGGVQDRSLYEDAIFAKMLSKAGSLNANDYQTYVSMAKLLSSTLEKPDVIVYLRCPPDVAHGRIMERARKAEMKIPIEYLEKLSKGYKKFISEIAQTIPVIDVDWTYYQKTATIANLVRSKVAKSGKSPKVLL